MWSFCGGKHLWNLENLLENFWKLFGKTNICIAIVPYVFTFDIDQLMKIINHKTQDLLGPLDLKGVEIRIKILFLNII